MEPNRVNQATQSSLGPLALPGRYSAPAGYGPSRFSWKPPGAGVHSALLDRLSFAMAAIRTHLEGSAPALIKSDHFAKVLAGGEGALEQGRRPLAKIWRGIPTRDNKQNGEGGFALSRPHRARARLVPGRVTC